MGLAANDALVTADTSTGVITDQAKVATANLQDGAVTAVKVAADVATQAELDAHVNDTTDAHDASAISVVDAGGYFAGTDAEAVLQEAGARVNQIFVPAQMFTANSGAPSLSTAAPSGRGTGWLFDAASAERIVTQVLIPAGWATMTATLVWANAGAGAGDVRWQFNGGSIDDGDDLTAFGTGLTTVNATTTAGTQWIAKRSTIPTITITTPGIDHMIFLQRNAADAADTLANDAAFYGLLLTRAT